MLLGSCLIERGAGIILPSQAESINALSGPAKPGSKMEIVSQCMLYSPIKHLKIQNK
jgi:hypothetical protein